MCLTRISADLLYVEVLLHGLRFQKNQNLLIGKQAGGPKVSCLTDNNEQWMWNVRSVYIPERFVTQLIRTSQGHRCSNTGSHWWICPVWGQSQPCRGENSKQTVFFFPFLKSHHMIPSLRYQISCCYEEQDRILFRSGKITNMANSGSWKESGDGDLTLLTVVQLIWMFMPHYLLSKKEK